MDFIEAFKNYLISQKNPPSGVTVKNYLADIRKFIHWHESTGQVFEPGSINSDIIDGFKRFSQAQFSLTSSERYLSSLRKFFEFLKTQGIMTTDPFQNLTSPAATESIAHKEFSQRWHITEFKNFLKIYNSSLLTIKNYIIDVRQFLAWLERLNVKTADNLFEVINDEAIETYKNSLISDNVYSVSSINRKLSSLRKYLTWAMQQGYLNKISRPKDDQPLAENTTNHTITAEKILERNSLEYPSEKYIKIEQTIKKAYSAIPPFRLVQKVLSAIDFLIEIFFVTPISGLINSCSQVFCKLQGKPFFVKNRLAFLEPTRRVPYAPNIPKMPPPEPHGFMKKTMYHLRYSRPKWYKRYHKHPVATYFHLSLLFIFSTIVGVSVYASFFQQPGKKQAEAANTVSPSRVLSFQGHLTDSYGNAITSPADLRFSLYNDLSATGAAELWQEVDYQVKPDSNGLFTVILGNEAPLPQSMFSQNPKMYLGVSVGTNEELVPRQQLTNTAYAANADLLQGLAPTTDNSVKGNQNTILALNSSGVLSINGTANTRFQSSNGQLTLQSKTLTLTTASGTNTDIELSPDGQGLIDVQKPLTNTTINNNIPSAKGAVEIDKMVAVLATSSGQSAMTIEQDGAGPLLSASVSGVEKFTIDNSGNITDPGYGKPNAVLFASPTTGLFSAVTTQTSSQCLLSGPGNNAIPSWGSCGSIASISANLTFALPNPRVDLLNNGTLGFYTSVGGNTGEVSNPALYISNSGYVGIGNTSPGYALDVAGKIRASNGFTGNCLNSTSYTNTGNCNQDLAEIYTASEDMTSGDLVAIDTRSNRAMVKKTTTPYDQNTIGVVTSKPGIILGINGSDVQVGGDTTLYMEHADPRKPAVALSGKVLVHVSTENGTIQPGDYLTSSSIPGVAMKATQPGEMIGKALEGFAASKGTVGKILTFINVSYGIPNIQLTDTGNLHITQVDPYKVLGINQQEISNFKFQISNKYETPITTVGAFAQAVIANLRSGGIQAETITAKSITVNGQSLQDYILGVIRDVGTIGGSNTKLISPLAEIDTIHTNVISPLSSDSIHVNGNVVIADSNGIASGSSTPRNDVLLDVRGSASVSGTLNTNNLAVNSNATVSGTLYAHQIQADQIIGLQEKVGTLAAQNITNVTNIFYSTPSGTPEDLGNRQERTGSSEAGILSSTQLSGLTDDKLATSNSNFQPLDSNVNIGSYSAYLAYVPHLDATTAQFDQGLISLGPTSLSDTTIAGQLAIGGQMILTDNSINVLGADLELQPLKQGGVSLLSGMVRIDSEGNLTVHGKAIFNNSIATNLISPLAGGDLTIQTNNNLVVKNASGSGVLTINQLGDIIASGAANITKLNLSIAAPAQAVSETEIIATSSAGTALINPFQREITIDTPLVTENSLIYITPVGTPSGQSPFLLRQVPGQSFTVGLSQPSDTVNQFNWLIIN